MCSRPLHRFVNSLEYHRVFDHGSVEYYRASKANLPKTMIATKGFGPVQKSSSSKAAAFFFARSVPSIREHGKRAPCLREAAAAGMEPLACQPYPWRRLADFFNRPIMSVSFALVASQARPPTKSILPHIFLSRQPVHLKSQKKKTAQKLAQDYQKFQPVMARPH